MRKAKVLHLITELDTGGAQVALLRLLSRLDRKRYSPRVACLYNGEAGVAQSIRALGIPVTDLRMAARWRLDAFARLDRLLRRERPDILHTWMFHANLPGRLLGRLAGVPIIISSERTMEMEGRLRRRLNRLTAPLADRVVCVSQNVAEFAVSAIGLPAEQLAVIPNGAPLEEFADLPPPAAARAALGLPAAGLLVGAAGRAHPVKGFTVLLEAFAALAPAHPGARLALAGDGPQLGALQAQSARLGLAGQVFFLGHCARIQTFLAALDVFVLPSFHEGLPNAVLEAMAAGRPVVATAVGGTPEAVLNDLTGLLVPPGDAPALSAALSALLADPGLRLRMGAAGRQRVAEHFSLDAVVRKTERLYASLLAGRRAA
jgi:glycosyltransferase involved in cell wall biosynthesis